jgi:putative peptidoglycan lipid II flippase
MAAGTCSVALVRQTVPVFYALERVRVPVVMTVLNICVFAVAAVLLMKPFGHVGLCMALSLAATAQGLGLVLALRARVGRLALLRIGLNWLRMLGASAPMAAAAWGVSLLGRWEQGGNSPRNIGVLGLAVAAGVVVYALVAWLFRSPELGELVAALRRRRDREGA